MYNGLRSFKGICSVLVMVLAILANMLLPSLASAVCCGGGGGGGVECYYFEDCTLCIIYDGNGVYQGYVTDCDMY